MILVALCFSDRLYKISKHKCKSYVYTNFYWGTFTQPPSGNVLTFILSGAM